MDSESDKHPVAAVSPGDSAGELRFIPMILPHVSASLISVRGLEETSQSTGHRGPDSHRPGEQDRSCTISIPTIQTGQDVRERGAIKQSNEPRSAYRRLQDFIRDPEDTAEGS